MSSIYHKMINLVFSIEIKGSPSRLVDIKVLESGDRVSSSKSVVIRGIFSIFIGMFVFVAASKASAQPQHLRSYFAVRIRYSANWC